MAKCQICGKGPMFGHNDTFSKKKTNRMFKVNVTKRYAIIGGKRRRVYMCNQCLKTMTRRPSMQFD